MDKQEQKYFDDTIAILKSNINRTRNRINQVQEEFVMTKKDLADNFYEVTKGQADSATTNANDLGNVFTYLNQLEELSVDLHNRLAQYSSQIKNPYFSRIDFKTDNSSDPKKIYIGLSNLMDDNNIIVYDWRAPISSMYYDYELGQASYSVGKEKYQGEIILKRQFKIENETLLSYFDTSLAIEDDILQEVLSKNSSAKMKQIVSSIQKEQNYIVRTEEFDNLLVQGVAGSGKTSIALHRAAYLLYSHRDTLKSNDILIMSPNNIFSSYISEVLPQLGEDNLVETSFEQISRMELKKPIESREKMLDRIASAPSQKELNDISFKSSFEYLGELIKFLRGDFLNTFTPQTLSFVVGIKKNKDESEEKIEETFPAEMTRKLFFENFKNMTIAQRINKIAWQYAMYFTKKRHYNKEQNRGLRERFKSLLYNFLPIKDIFKIFEIFITRMGLTLLHKDEIGYMDKGALLIIKNYIFGLDHDFSAKYLIIDEMQDFTPVDLFIFKKMWSCPSIVLGDINQCIEKTLSPDYLKEMSSLLGTELLELKKTYRSTKEIAQFAHNMIGIKNIEYVNRSGQEPRLYITEDVANAIKKILDNECKNFAHIAIICKCQSEVDKLSRTLKGKVNFKELRDPEDYNNRVLLTTCATAKGIEFDCVIIPYADKDNYKNSLDKNILYVSSTRALHKLFFITENTPTTFLKDIKDIQNL